MSARIAALMSAGTLIAMAHPALAQGQSPEIEVETVLIEEGTASPYGAPSSRYATVAQLPQAPQGQRWVRASELAEVSSAAPRLGYDQADREAWLADCTILLSERPDYADDYYDNNADGGLLGGLLGAIVGGVAGNRIAGGDRLAGTLIGGGLGGIAGAILGNVLDGDDDEIEEVAFDSYAADYCSAYLRRYEAQGSGAFGEQGYQRVAVSRATTRQSLPLRREVCRSCGDDVIEEVVIEEPTAARAIPRRAQPTPTPTKLIPVK